MDGTAVARRRDQRGADFGTAATGNPRRGSRAMRSFRRNRRNRRPICPRVATGPAPHAPGSSNASKGCWAARQPPRATSPAASPSAPARTSSLNTASRCPCASAESASTAAGSSINSPAIASAGQGNRSAGTSPDEFEDRMPTPTSTVRLSWKCRRRKRRRHYDEDAGVGVSPGPQNEKRLPGPLQGTRQPPDMVTAGSSSLEDHANRYAFANDGVVWGIMPPAVVRKA